MEIAKVNFPPIMYLFKEHFTCPKGQIMHKQLRLALTVLMPNVNIFLKNGIMKPDINSYEYSVDPDQLASSKTS